MKAIRCSARTANDRRCKMKFTDENQMFCHHHQPTPPRRIWIWRIFFWL